MKTVAAIFLATILVSGTVIGTETDLKEMLKADDPEVRSDACLELVEAGPEAVALLTPLLRDRSMLVRHCAAYALSRIGGAEVERIFKKGLRAGNFDVRRISALGLGMIEEADIIDAIVPLLKDTSWEVRWSAAFALGRSKDRRALTPLGPVAEKDPYYDESQKSYPVREAAEKAMRRLNAVIGWQTEPEKAFSLSRAEDKPILLYFRKTGSRLCTQFERILFREEKVIDTVQRFVPLWLDHMVLPELFSRYGVKKVPAIIFLSPNGSELERVEGTIGPSDLLVKMLGLLEKEKSVSRLRSRFHRDPQDLEAAWQLAELYMEEGLWDKACLQLELIISNDPYNQSSLLDNALFARAYIRGKLGDYESSRQEFKDLVERFPSFGERAQALYCWGLSALKVGKIEEGEMALRMLSEQYPASDLAGAALNILAYLKKK